jgi:hypothetical protein
MQILAQAAIFSRLVSADYKKCLLLITYVLLHKPCAEMIGDTKMARLLIAVLLMMWFYPGSCLQTDQQTQKPYVVPAPADTQTVTQPTQPSDSPQQQPYVVPPATDAQTPAQPTQPSTPEKPYVFPAGSDTETVTQPSAAPQQPGVVPAATDTQAAPQPAPPSGAQQPPAASAPTEAQPVEPAQPEVQPSPPQAAPAAPSASDTQTVAVPAQSTEAPQKPSAVPSSSQAGAGSTQAVEPAEYNPGPESKSKKHKNKKSISAVNTGPVIWTDPGDISHRDLFYGQGGRDHQPKPPFKYLDEDKKGTNPKFDVEDGDGKKWRVKLGAEARPEVVASRLLWAVGFFANDDYFVEHASAPGIELSRGQNLIEHHSDFKDARFSRRPKQEKKIGIWKWKSNPLVNTREFNGLRVMMALMNGWDLKDENNAVYEDEKTGRQIYLASDVGATFGTNGLSLTHARSKGNVHSFKNSKFITKVNAGVVDFATPAKPVAPLVTSLGFRTKEFVERCGYQWIGRNIPLQDARWMASLLGKLSHQQLTDAFRAGGFPADDVDEYVALIESRIDELKAL